MFFAIPMLLLQGAILYFAFIGIKATIEKSQGAHGLTMIRDLMKYLALLISVVITCLGLAGLLTLVIDNQTSSYDDKLSAARWLSFVFIGIPVIAIIARWIKKDFTKDIGASQEPAWQIYLLAGSTLSLMIWFIPLSSALKWLAGGEYQPRALAQSLIAFAVYFGCWHAMRHTARLTLTLASSQDAFAQGDSSKAFTRAVIPGIPALLGTFLIAGALALMGNEFNDDFFWMALVIVWALTVPHMAVTAKLDRSALT